MPDIVNVGAIGPGNTVAGAIGGVVGALILQTLTPPLSGIDYGPSSAR